MSENLLQFRNGFQPLQCSTNTSTLQSQGSELKVVNGAVIAVGASQGDSFQRADTLAGNRASNQVFTFDNNGILTLQPYSQTLVPAKTRLNADGLTYSFEGTGGQCATNYNNVAFIQTPCGTQALPNVAQNITPLMPDWTTPYLKQINGGFTPPNCNFDPATPIPSFQNLMNTFAQTPAELKSVESRNFIKNYCINPARWKSPIDDTKDPYDADCFILINGDRDVDTKLFSGYADAFKNVCDRTDAPANYCNSFKGIPTVPLGFPPIGGTTSSSTGLGPEAITALVAVPILVIASSVLWFVKKYDRTNAFPWLAGFIMALFLGGLGIAIYYAAIGKASWWVLAIVFAFLVVQALIIYAIYKLYPPPVKNGRARRSSSVSEIPAEKERNDELRKVSDDNKSILVEEAPTPSIDITPNRPASQQIKELNERQKQVFTEQIRYRLKNNNLNDSL